MVAFWSPDAGLSVGCSYVWQPSEHTYQQQPCEAQRKRFIFKKGGKRVVEIVGKHLLATSPAASGPEWQHNTNSAGSSYFGLHLFIIKSIHQSGRGGRDVHSM